MCGRFYVGLQALILVGVAPVSLTPRCRAANTDPGHSYSKKHSKADSYIFFDRSEFIREEAGTFAAFLPPEIVFPNEVERHPGRSHRSIMN